MDWVAIREKGTQAIKKYKYVLLILALGMVLMAIPEGGEQDQEEVSKETIPTQISASEELALILGKIDGVGKVEVLLTEAKGSQTVYQTDEDSTVSSDSSSIRVETVIISDANRGEYGLVQRVDPPTYMGAIVVCQGADRPSIRLSVVEAVSNATGIGTDRITVLKMK